MSYDPTIGRWTSEDPIGFKAGDTNLYRYVGNCPTNVTDSSGEDWVYPWEDGANWWDWRLGEAIGDTINNLQGGRWNHRRGVSWIGPCSTRSGDCRWLRLAEWQ
jgi:uncharacterized protein RhaS with RHS repeats